MKKTGKKVSSVFLSVLMLISMCTSGLISHAAGAGITITQDGTEVTERLSVQEYRSIQLEYITTGELPDGAYVTWESTLPLLAGVDDTGKVTGYDYSKAAIVQQWIDENIRSMPVVGEAMAKSIEDQIAATGVDLEDMDTTILIAIIRGIAGDALADSLQKALDSMNVEIVAVLHAADSKELARDSVEVVVEKSLIANIAPTAVHITNKRVVPLTVAVGTTVQLYGACSPVRLKQSVKWTMGGTIFDTESGKHANVSADGLVTFTSAGKVTVRLTPTNAAYAAFVDTITFTVVEQADLPVEDFSIAGNLKVDEGATTQLAIADLQPAGAYTGDLTWSSSDPTVAAVDQNGVVTGLDGGSGLTTYSRTAEITATVGGISKTVTVTVNRKVVNAVISGVEIIGETVIPNNASVTYTAKITPDRLNTSSSVKREWGITEPLTGEIVWATTDAPAETSIAVINAEGVLSPKQSGIIVIHVRATQGEVVCEASLTVSAGTPITSFNLEKGDGFTVNILTGSREPFLEEGKTAQLNITSILPEDFDRALLENVTWTSSDPTAVSVDADGKVLGLDCGSAGTLYNKKTVTVTASVGGVSASITFDIRGASVRNLVSASISGSDYVIKDFPRTYESTFYPTRVAVKDKHWGVPTDAGERPWASAWSSTKGNQQNSVASVDNNGVVTGLSAGETTLYVFGREGATTVNGSFAEAEKKIQVVELEPDSITLAAPTRKNYVEGETELDLSGLKVSLNYNRETISQYYDTADWEDKDFTVEVTDYTVSEINQKILDSEQYILVTVTRAGEEYRGVFPIILESKKVESLDLTAPRYAYTEGETRLDLTGLEVTANYSNAPSELVTDYVVYEREFDPTLLDVEQNITVSYTHAGVSASATFPVIVYGTPVVSVDTGEYTGGWTPADVTFTLSATHPMDGVTYYYRTSAETEWTALAGNTLTVAENSQNTYFFKAVNSVDAESAETEGITVLRDDITPSFTLSQSVTDITNQSYTVSVDGLSFGASGVQAATLNGTDILANYANFTVHENGTYTVRITAGNGLYCEQTVTVENIDKIAPTVDRVELQQKNSGGFARFLNDLTYGKFFKEQIELTISASDEGVAGIDRIEYRFYNADTDTYSEWMRYSDSNKPVQNPKFRGYAEARATDRAANTSATYTSEGFVIDNVRPADVQISATYNGADYNSGAWVAGNVELTLDSSAYSGIYAYYYRVDGGEWTQLSDNTLTASEEGRHVYEFKAESNSSMESYETMQVVQIDTQKPVIRVTFDGTFGRWTSDGVRFNFATEEDSLSGITYYYNNGTGWQEFDGAELFIDWNTHAPYTFKAVNGAGTESTTSDSYNVMIDVVEPQIILTPTVTEPTCTPYEVQIETIVGEAGLAKVMLDNRNITTRKSFMVSRNGNYIITALGNNGLVTTKLLTVDNFYTPVLEVTDIAFGEASKTDNTDFGTYYGYAPEITISAQNTGTTGIAEITYRLLDENGKAASAWEIYEAENKPVLADNFRGYVEARAYDTANKASALYRSKGITVDTAAPTAPVITAALNDGTALSDSAWAKSAVTLKPQSSAFSGIQQYCYSMDGGAWQTLTGDRITCYETGVHTWQFKAVSAVGTESAITTYTTRIDSETPILQIGVQGAIGVKTNKPITFSLYTPNCLSDVTYYYSIGDGWVEMDTDTLTIAEEMRAVYRFKATNAAGKESYVSPEYSVWFEKPEIEQIQPKTDGSTNLMVDRDHARQSYLLGMCADNTTVEKLRQDLENNAVQIVVTRDGTVLNDTDCIGTGCVVQCVSVEDASVVYETVTVILYGDVNGDGKIDSADYALMQTAALVDADAIGTGAYTLAADVNGDGVVDFFDIAMMDMQISQTVLLDQTVQYYKSETRQG